MAQIVLTIPDPVLPRMIQGLSEYYGYQPTLKDPSDITKTIPNPETRAQFAKRMLIFHIKKTMIQAEGGPAATTARETVTNDILTNVSIT